MKIRKKVNKSELYFKLFKTFIISVNQEIYYIILIYVLLIFMFWVGLLDFHSVTMNYLPYLSYIHLPNITLPKLDFRAK